MLEYIVISLLVAVALMLIGKARRGSELRENIAAMSELIACINMYSVERSIAGDKEFSDTTAQIAQHLRDGVASVTAGHILYPATTPKQVQVFSRLIEDPYLMSRFMTGQGELEIARAHIALRKVLERLLQLARVG